MSSSSSSASSSPSASIPALKSSTDTVEFMNYWLRDQNNSKNNSSNNSIGAQPLRNMDGYTYYAKFIEQYGSSSFNNNGDKNKKFNRYGSVYNWLLRNTHHAQNHRLGNYFYRPYSRRHEVGGLQSGIGPK